MLTLVLGGAASGKSGYAESLVLKTALPRYYIATMQVWDAECAARVEKHRRMRAAKQFETVECPLHLDAVRLPARGTALLEEDTLTLHTYTPDTETYRRTADCTERQQLTETTVTEQFAPQAEPYPEMLANFADAILHGTPLTAPGVEGVRALELTDAAYLSAWLGEKLTLPLDADRFEQELQKHIQEEQTNG